MKASGILIFLVVASLFLTPVYGSQKMVQASLLPWLESHIDQSADTILVYQTLMGALHNAGNELPPDRVGKLYSILGRYHKLYGKLDSAVYYYSQAFNLFQKGEDKLILAQVSLKMADVYSLKGDYVHSMKQVYDALDFYEKIKDQQGIAQ